ncbi:SufE family protein [Tepidiforma sp.]|uniref:SufE family protein n=1 Tax=Tepidiforma sp. TaxID=2682230 RepID=UPI002ADE34EA|nr:SufE family protein [Tepidiforma sp.]
MATPPEAFQKVLEDFQWADRTERIDLLIGYADRFKEVPPTIATRPFPEEHHVQKCESDAYVWAEDLPDGTLKFHFAVENPQGLSAKAWAVILDETLSGQPLEQVAAVPCDSVFTVFGKEVSMGKGMGLMGIVDMVTAFARQRLNQRGADQT